MNRRIILLWLLTGTLSVASITAGCTLWQRQAPPREIPLPMTPAAQAARLSAAILSRKVERLRQEALSLRFRDEGLLLLQALQGDVVVPVATPPPS